MKKDDYRNHLGVPTHGIGNLLDRVSTNDKKKNDWEWVEEWVDYYDNAANITDSGEEKEKILLNYNMFNGRGGYQTKAPENVLSSKELEEEGFYFGDEEIPHIDIITPVVRSMIGQQQQMSFKPMASDSSITNVNSRHKKKLQLRQQYIEQTIINPAKEQATKEWSIDNNVQDIYSLSPEQQQQAQSDIDNRVKILLPHDIERFMAEEYKSPSETQLQKITDFVCKRDKLKFWTDENFKHFLISGKQVYETGIRNNKAFFRILNPINFEYGRSSSTYFIEDGDWGKYVEYVTLSEMFNDHGAYFKKGDIDKIKNGYTNGHSTFNKPYSTELADPYVSKLAEWDSKTNMLKTAPPVHTREWHQWMNSLYNNLSTEYNGNLQNIRRVRVVYKALRRLFLVTRYNREQNKYEQFWVDDTYVKNPKLDVKIEEVWCPHMYGAYKYMDDIYVEKGPLEYQYNSINDPWNIKLPFMGVEYSRLFDNTRNIAPMDLAKPWQDKFNIQMAKITEIEATDIGRVLLFAQSMKPEGWTWGKFLKMLKYGKIAPIDTSDDKLNGIDAQMLKDVNLSQISDLAPKLQYLEFLKNQAALAMSYNPSRLGQIAPSMAVTNNQQNIQQSTYQTQDLYTLHNEVVERVLLKHILNERAALQDNEYIASYVLDDMSIADLKLDKELFNVAEIGISIRNSSQDYNNVMEVKQLGQAMIQNGMITMPELIRLMWANNGAEILNIAERAEKKMLERQQQQQQSEQENIKAQQESQMQLVQLQQQYDALQKQLDRDLQLKGYELESVKFANQQDIDKNNVSKKKKKEREVMENEKEEKKLDRQHELDKEKLKGEIAEKIEKIKGMYQKSKTTKK